MALTYPGADTLRSVHRDIDRILIDRGAIADRVRSLGVEISRDLESVPGDVEIVLVPVLTGAIIFVADLIRELPQKIQIAVIEASSYTGRTTVATQEPVIGPAPPDLGNKHVLIVDDILDSGTTIQRIRGLIEDGSPRSVRTCVLLRKDLPSAREIPCEYVGFDIPDEFVVGYGLDYDGHYRNLPDIGVLKKEAL
jgi:hypoxanthine phosphoribosyltransferase